MVTDAQRYMIESWQTGASLSFTSKLLTLLCAADLGNQAKLGAAFPEVFAAFKWWQSGAFEAERSGK